MDRRSEISRQNKEVAVSIRLNLDGSGKNKISTGVPSFDQLLAQMATQGLLDLTILAQGDVHINDHHTVETVGAALGQALHRALGDRKKLARYGSAILAVDDALLLVALDLAGHGHLSYDVAFPQPGIGQFDAQLIEAFLCALANSAQITLHLRLLSGRSGYHIAEAIFRALGRALYDAASLDLRRLGVPSGKGEE